MLRKAIVFCLILVWLAACSPPGTRQPQPTATLAAASPASPSPSPTPTAAPAPTLTPVTHRLLLIAPKEADAQMAASIRGLLVELTTDTGLVLTEQPALTSSSLDESVKIVMVLAPFANLADFIAQAPRTQFVSVGIQGLPAAGNLTRIGDSGFRPDQQAFMAGYIAAITAQDWRAGVLAVDSPQGTAAVDAFFNGVRFFCGLCRPAFPPFFTYPQSAQTASPGDKASWQPTADLLIARAVQTVYITPDAASAELLQYLADAGMHLIGGKTSPAALGAQWVATIQPDPSQALRNLWNDLLAGKGGQTVPMPLAVTDTQSGLLSAARLRLVQATLDDLVAGRIDPGPLSGP